MTTIERTFPMTTNPAVRSSKAVDAWVVEVLDADDLKLAEAKRSEPYGRATLGTGTKLLMWAMRLYVLFSVVLIAAQVYISLHAR